MSLSYVTIAYILTCLDEKTHRIILQRMTPESLTLLDAEFTALQRLIRFPSPTELALLGKAVIHAWMAGCSDQQVRDLKLAGIRGTLVTEPK